MRIRLFMISCFLLGGFTAPIFGAENNDKGQLQPLPQIEDRYRALETFARAIYYLESMYYDPTKVTHDNLVEHALKGIVEDLDPHTMIMPKRAFEQLAIDTQGKFGGVGIIVSQERGKLIVVSPIEDTPAMKAGVLSGDEIIGIDGKEVTPTNGNEAVELMRGEPGSHLILVIKRAGVEKPLKFDLVREVIRVNSVRGLTLGAGILYARITSFQENTGEDLRKLLQKHESQMRGLILDLRDNPGGLLDQAVLIVDHFIESGLIVSTVGRNPDKIEREFAQKRGTFMGFPMIVLVNDGSASASEIVAGALQDHQRAIILGTQTFGKGSVQTLVSLPDGSGLKLTVARYYTPKDRSIQAKGITPDIMVEAQAGSVLTRQKHPKESDLKGHIEGKDLSDIATQQKLLSEIATWPKAMGQDSQLTTAFTYLKGWSLFQK